MKTSFLGLALVLGLSPLRAEASSSRSHLNSNQRPVAPIQLPPPDPFEEANKKFEKATLDVFGTEDVRAAQIGHYTRNVFEDLLKIHLQTIKQCFYGLDARATKPLSITTSEIRARLDSDFLDERDAASREYEKLRPGLILTLYQALREARRAQEFEVAKRLKAILGETADPQECVEKELKRYAGVVFSKLRPKGHFSPCKSGDK